MSRLNVNGCFMLGGRKGERMGDVLMHGSGSCRDSKFRIYNDRLLLWRVKWTGIVHNVFIISLQL